MPEDAGLQRGVRADLDDDRRLDLREGNRQPPAAEAPGADPVRPRVVGSRGPEDGGQLLGLPRLERAAAAHDDELAVPYEAGDQLAGPLDRADDAAGDDLDIVPRLDLQPLPAARRVACGRPLDDQALDSRRAEVGEPLPGLVDVGGER